MSAPDSSKNHHRWLRRSVLALATLAVLYIGTAFVLSRFLDPDELAGWLEPRIEKAMNRDVEVGGVEVGFFPLAVRLKALEVSDPTGLAQELAYIGSLELRVKILPLLRREIQVSRLVVEELRAELRVSENGLSNFGDLSTRPTEEADPEGTEKSQVRPGEGTDAGLGSEEGNREPFSVNLQGIRFESGQIRFADERKDVEVQLADLGLRAAARRDSGGGWVLVGSSDGRLTFQEGKEAPLLEAAPLELAFDLLMSEGFEQLTIRTGELSVQRVALALEGRIDDLQDPVRTASLALRGGDLPLSDILAILPDSVRGRIPVEAEGSIRVDVMVEGEIGPGRLPSVTGTVALANGTVSRRGDPVAEGLTVALDLTPEKTIKSRAQATLLGGPVSLEGTTTLGSEGAADLVLRATPELAGLGSFVEFPDGVSAEGKVDVDLRITSPIGNFREARFQGTVAAVGVHATHPGLGVPVEISDGAMELSGIKATVRDLPVKLGEDQFFITGELSDVFALLLPDQTPHFQGSVRGARLNLPELKTRTRPDPSLTYGKVAFAKVGDRPVGGGGFQAAAEALGLNRPESLPIGGTLDVALDRVIDNQGPMENVRAHINFGPSFVEVTNTTFDRFGGRISTALDLSLASSDAAPFSLSLKVEDLDAGEFLANTTPLGSFVRGTISLEMDIIGTLDGFLLPDRPALVGSVRFSLTNGGLNPTPLTQAVSTFLGMEALRNPSIRDWTSSIVLEEGRVLLADARIQGAPGSPEVGGRIGLNGELDLRSAFDIPSDRLSTAALDRLGIAGEIAARVAQRPEVVQAILRIGGSIANPAVNADPAAAARTLGRAVEEEVRAEAQKRIDAEKARAERALEEQRAEAQRKIQEQKDQLRNRATGFLQNLVRPRETNPPDTVTPDTLVSDSLPVGPSRPDTVRPDTMRPDRVRPDTMRPDTVRPDTMRPDTVRPDTMRPDTVRPDTVRPDTMRPDTVRPATMRPDTLLQKSGSGRDWPLSPSSPSGSPPPIRGRKLAPGPWRR